jgi:hypothetical protein
MRKANYDKFPSTKLAGMLVQGWDAIISVLKKQMDARKVLAVDLYTGVYEEEVLDAFSKEFSGKVMNVRDLMKPEQEIQNFDGTLHDGRCVVWLCDQFEAGRLF